jgi:hypothetical protein
MGDGVGLELTDRLMSSRSKPGGRVEGKCCVIKEDVVVSQ